MRPTSVACHASSFRPTPASAIWTSACGSPTCAGVSSGSPRLVFAAIYGNGHALLIDTRRQAEDYRKTLIENNLTCSRIVTMDGAILNARGSLVKGGTQYNLGNYNGALFGEPKPPLPPKPSDIVQAQDILRETRQSMSALEVALSRSSKAGDSLRAMEEMAESTLRKLRRAAPEVWAETTTLEDIISRPGEKRAAAAGGEGAGASKKARA